MRDSDALEFCLDAIPSRKEYRLIFSSLSFSFAVLNGLDEGMKMGKLGPAGTSQPPSPGATRPGSRKGSQSGGVSGNKLQMSSS